MNPKRLMAALLAAGLYNSGAALATNGMLMEGYGPVATAMGGAAMAYDNGNAAMANNPATLGLMAMGSRLDIALGFIGPDVTITPGGKSRADAFYMPAFGYVKKYDKLAYGVGVYAQGGMGTEYPNADMAQVGVGRVIFPVAYNVTDAFTIGGSIDYVWAGMDLVFGNYGLYFKDHRDYTGKAKGQGIAAKLGFTYKLNDRLNVGGVYQTSSNLSDLKGDGYRVQDFDMPPVIALGVSWQANEKLRLVADVKDLLWNSSMNTVSILYPGAEICNPGLNCAPFQQDWSDQVVIAIGASYKITDTLTGRIGYNHADNPIPTEYMNFLWPAIVEDHYTFGFGYELDKDSGVDFSLSYVPELSQLHGMNVEHRQVNWQLMYNKKF